MQQFEWDFAAAWKPCLEDPEARAEQEAATEAGREPIPSCIGRERCAWFAMCDLAHKRPWEPPTLPQSASYGPAPEFRLISTDPRFQVKQSDVA